MFTFVQLAAHAERSDEYVVLVAPRHVQESQVATVSKLAVHCICLTAKAKATELTAAARSVIFMSGTLKPEQFAAEMGFDKADMVTACTDELLEREGNVLLQNLSNPILRGTYNRAGGVRYCDYAGTCCCHRCFVRAGSLLHQVTENQIFDLRR